MNAKYSQDEEDKRILNIPKSEDYSLNEDNID